MSFILKSPSIPNKFLQIQIWLHLIRVTKFHYTFVFIFFKKEIQMIMNWSLHPAVAFSRTFKLSKGTTSFPTPLSWDPGRSFRRFLHKNKISSNERFSLSPERRLQRSHIRTTLLCASQGERQGSPGSLPKQQLPELQSDSSKIRKAAISDLDGTSKTHKTVISSHLVSVLLRRDQALEERVYHR